ncbi:MAG TPA: hypothetical protein VNI02_12855, partial [Blastocatellia bacterium]|nr:hypothetical protein [Blastocatellia bacterium]
ILGLSEFKTVHRLDSSDPRWPERVPALEPKAAGGTPLGYVRPASVQGCLITTLHKIGNLRN